MTPNVVEVMGGHHIVTLNLTLKVIWNLTTVFWTGTPIFDSEEYSEAKPFN